MSFQASATALDGGDQIAAVITLLLLPVALSMGLVSFALVMFGCLVLHLRPSDHPVTLRIKELSMASPHPPALRGPGRPGRTRKAVIRSLVVKRGREQL
ncbi:hypothetical protein SAMN05421505_11125 [Sinosporangium album]|uniref:Uncharacterized protein n=1 Tax=Sinosporangium album TaxID=504805 RepID=A0A1G7ZEJ0_9ACTN|nr:hypothetical protein [Sinosporangium album]SDH07162.1 hypothetical protein SAMN05421505_11125 [Sinosporangium album]